MNRKQHYTYAFENLEVWQQSKSLTTDVYQLTNKFPPEERYGLAQQLRRAAISVCSNIAEGSTRWSKRDKARFYEIAYGSLIELLNQVLIAVELTFVSESEMLQIRQQIEHISPRLSALHRSAKRA